MTDLTPEEILSAIDRALERVSRRFAANGTQPRLASNLRATAGKSSSGAHKVRRVKSEISKVSP